MSKYRPESLKTLSNILWLLLRHTGVPASAMPKQQIYKALEDLQKEVEWHTQDAVKQIVRKETINLIAETRLIKGKVERLTDMVAALQEEQETDGAS